MGSQLRRIQTTLKQLDQKYKNLHLEDQANYTPFGEETLSTTKIESESFSPPQPVENGANTSNAKTKTALDLPSFQLENSRQVPRRYGFNSQLPMNLLLDLQEKIVQWQKSLGEIQQQIQQIYQEGPLLDAWLECNDQQSFTINNQPRKATTDHLMGYVEELKDHNISYQNPRHGYYLCGKDETGKIWSHPCPSDQIVEVTMAIARYQKLQDLLTKKQKVETRLNQLAEGLVILHSSLQHDL